MDVVDGESDAMMQDGSRGRESGETIYGSQTGHRAFIPLRTSRACDICKLRKVKCDGGDPCNACRLHTLACIYSGTTRRQLLNTASKGEAYDIGDMSFTKAISSGSDAMASSFFREPSSSHSHRHYNPRDSAISDPYEFSSAKQMNPVRFDFSRGPSLRESMGNDSGRTFGLSDIPKPPGSLPIILSPIQSTPDGPSRFFSSRKSYSSGNQSFTSPTIYNSIPELPDRSAYPTSTPDPGSSRHYSESTRMTYPMDHSATEIFTPSTSSGLVMESSGLDQEERGPTRKDWGPFCPHGLSTSSRSPALDVFRTDADGFGNAGLTTFRSGMDVTQMEYWGVTSYLALQDLLARMIRTKLAHYPGYKDKPFARSTGGKPEQQDFSVWRWGCDVYINHNQIESSVGDNTLDPMFLPAELAYRFFNAYKAVIHPLFPVLRLDAVRDSIFTAYTLGVTDPKPRSTSGLAIQTHSLDRARDFMVMSFGAQIEGGNGDAECHKDVARAWSEILKRRAKEIMLQHGQGKGGVELVNLWVIMAAYSRSYGNSDEELSSIGFATRLTGSIGLNRVGIYDLPVAEQYGFRKTLCVCYHMEKWASLCHGIPSNLVRSDEFDAILAGLSDNRFYLLPLVGLADLMGQVQAMFDNLKKYSSVQAGFSRASELYENLIQFRERMPEEFEHFENASGPDTIDLNTPEGERMVLRFNMCGIFLQLKILVLLPIFEMTIWAAIKGESISYSDHLRRLSNECVEAALVMVHAFERYHALLPHIPELSLSAILLLYALSVIYMDVLQLPPGEAVETYVGVVQTVARLLDHYDHPAARVAQAMCHDLLLNQLHVTPSG